MNASLRNAILFILLLVIGGAVAFFIFAAAFVLPNLKFLISALAILSLALLVSGVIAFFQPKNWRSIGIVLSLPTALMALYCGISVAFEGNNATGWIAVGISGMLFPIAGAWLGRYLKNRRA